MENLLLFPLKVKLIQPEKIDPPLIELNIRYEKKTPKKSIIYSSYLSKTLDLFDKTDYQAIGTLNKRRNNDYPLFDESKEKGRKECTGVDLVAVVETDASPEEKSYTGAINRKRKTTSL